MIFKSHEKKKKDSTWQTYISFYLSFFLTLCFSCLCPLTFSRIIPDFPLHELPLHLTMTKNHLSSALQPYIVPIYTIVYKKHVKRE